MRNSVYKDNHIEITESDNMFYIESFKNGMTPDKFKDIMGRLPLIKITSFFALRTALLKAPHAPILFGERKERIITEISGDGLKAYITLNIPEEEFKPENRKKLIEEVLGVLAKERIVYGVKSEVLNSGLVPFEKILIAAGGQIRYVLCCARDEIPKSHPRGWTFSVGCAIKHKAHLHVLYEGEFIQQG
jgi:hypothetical protein